MVKLFVKLPGQRMRIGQEEKNVSPQLLVTTPEAVLLALRPHFINNESLAYPKHA